MPDDTIVITAPSGTKARWVRQSQRAGKKLSSWIIERVDGPPGPTPLVAMVGNQIIEVVYLQDELDSIKTDADARAAVADGRAAAIIERLTWQGARVGWLVSVGVEDT